MAITASGLHHRPPPTKQSSVASNGTGASVGTAQNDEWIRRHQGNKGTNL